MRSPFISGSSCHHTRFSWGIKPSHPGPSEALVKVNSLASGSLKLSHHPCEASETLGTVDSFHPVSSEVGTVDPIYPVSSEVGVADQ